MGDDVGTGFIDDEHHVVRSLFFEFERRADRANHLSDMSKLGGLGDQRQLHIDLTLHDSA